MATPPGGTVRQHKRYPVSWVVSIRAEDWSYAHELATGNISRGGLFVRSVHPLETGTKIEIDLQLPEDMVLRAESVVVHSIPPERAQGEGIAPGFGVRFLEQHATDLALLEGMASTHSQGAYTFPADDEYITLRAQLLGVEGGERFDTTAHKLIERSAAGAAADGEGEDGVEVIVDEPGYQEAAMTGPLPPRVKPALENAIFGIDFGTSYTSIAVVEGNKVRVLQDEEGQYLLPSVVSYPEEGAPLVGWPAKEKIATLPGTTFTSPKRLIGRAFRDPRLDSIIGGSPVRYVEGPGGTVVAEIYGQQLAIPQVCTEVFRRVAEIGWRASGVPVERVVLSAPVAFGGERAAIKRAAERAGLAVMGMIDEPVAAAMAFGLGLAPGQRVAVYDFGGGTFDFTLLGIKESGGFEVLGEAGDPWLGGDDFDLALANHVANEFWRKHKVDLRERTVEWQRVLLACEHAKRKLSMQPTTAVRARGIVLSLRGAIDLDVEASRELLDGLCGGLVDSSLDCVGQCLEMAGVGPDEIEHLVLTGGTSRMPLVRQRVQQFFQREIALLHDPEVAIVSGNALYGRFLALRAADTARAGRR
jgi:actin-like ATPase involved in cell morphogenesis